VIVTVGLKICSICDSNKKFVGLAMCNWEVGIMSSTWNTLYSLGIHFTVLHVIGCLVLGKWNLKELLRLLS
jgi:hypothetical protein